MKLNWMAVAWAAMTMSASAIAAPARAVPCMVMGESGFVVTANGKTFDKQASLPDCTNATVTSGKGRVYARTASGETYSISVSAGDLLSKKLWADSSGSLSTFMNVIASMQQKPGTRIGGKWLKQQDVTPGFPFDGVFPSKSGLTFNFYGNTKLIDFALREVPDGRLVFSQAGTVSGRFSVPASVLLHDREYAWTFRTQAGHINGRFQMLDKATADQVDAELKKSLSDPTLSRQDMLLIEALVFEANGLAFDRERVLAEMGTVQ